MSTTLDQYRDELLRSYEDDGSGNWLNALARHGWQIAPQCRGLEFEIKYAPRESASSREVGIYVRDLRSADLPDPIVSPDWIGRSESEATYWLSGGVEWSLQRSRSGRERLKRKSHRIYREESGDIPLFQSEEDFIENAQEVSATARTLTNPIGRMHKLRAKTYLVRLDTGMVFNITESHCTAGDARQVQVELEYSCHLARTAAHEITPAQPQDIRNALWQVHRMLAPGLASVGLVPTTERKQDFVRESAGPLG